MWYFAIQHISIQLTTAKDKLQSVIDFILKMKQWHTFRNILILIITVVMNIDHHYYRHRPEIGLPKSDLRILDDHFGLNPGMAGLEGLFKDGKMAIVHGCGYDNPSFSHFTSMAYWHTAAPNSGEEYGWVGRLADDMEPSAPANYLVNVAARQSLAVRSKSHVPVVFDQPNRFVREAFHEEKNVLWNA